MEAVQRAVVGANALARRKVERREVDDLLDRADRYLLERCAHTDDIKTAISQFYCLDRSALSIRLRISEVTFARQMFCFLAYRYTRLSLKGVGLKVGLVNHTTVLHAVRRIEKSIITKPLFADDVDLLRLKLLELTWIRKEAGTC